MAAAARSASLTGGSFSWASAFSTAGRTSGAGSSWRTRAAASRSGADGENSRSAATARCERATEPVVDGHLLQLVAIDLCRRTGERILERALTIDQDRRADVEVPLEERLEDGQSVHVGRLHQGDDGLVA